MSGDGTTIVACHSNFGKVAVFKLDAISRQWRQFGDAVDADVSISTNGTMVVVISNLFSESDGLTIVRVSKFDLRVRDWEQLGSEISIEVGNGIRVEDIDLSGDGTTLFVDFGDIKAYTLNTSTSDWAQLGPTVTNFGATAMSASSRTIVDTSRYNNTLLRLSPYRYLSAQSRWQRLGPNIDIPASNSDYFGDVVISADGSTIAFAKLGTSFPGIVQVYKYQPSPPRWVKFGDDFKGEASDIGFGSTISLSEDGSTVAIGVARQNGLSGQPLATRWLRLGRNTSNTINIKRLLCQTKERQLQSALLIINLLITNTAFQLSHQDAMSHGTSDQCIGRIRNGTIFTRPPPCNVTNIEAIIPLSSLCTIPTNRTVLKLYSQDMTRLIAFRNETARYFLFGNNGSDISNGRIAPGTYNLQVNVNGWNSPPTLFTLQSNRSCF